LSRQAAKGEDDDDDDGDRLHLGDGGGARSTTTPAIPRSASGRRRSQWLLRPTTDFKHRPLGSLAATGAAGAEECTARGKKTKGKPRA